MIRKRGKTQWSNPWRRSGKDLQLSNSSVTSSMLNLTQMFPYANKELSDKTSKTIIFFLTPWSSTVLVCNTRQAARHVQNHTHTLEKHETLSPQWCHSHQRLVQSNAVKKTPNFQTLKLQKVNLFLYACGKELLTKFPTGRSYIPFCAGTMVKKVLKSRDFETDPYSSSKLSIWNGMRVDKVQDVVETRWAEPLE